MIATPYESAKEPRLPYLISSARKPRRKMTHYRAISCAFAELERTSNLGMQVVAAPQPA